MSLHRFHSAQLHTGFNTLLISGTINACDQCKNKSLSAAVAHLLPGELTYTGVLCHRHPKNPDKTSCLRMCGMKGT